MTDLTPRLIAEAIVVREGGYVNDPDDPGGATKYGVTIGTLRALGLDKTGDGRVTVEDVKALTREDAVDIFLRHYFEGPKIDTLPDGLQATVFDMQVNAGGNAVRILQKLLVKMGYDVGIDGAIGPQTAGAARQAWQAGGRAVYNAYGIERRNYYFAIADRRPASRKYARTRAGGKGGWIIRAEEFMDARYHMTDAAFQARVATWR